MKTSTIKDRAKMINDTRKTIIKIIKLIYHFSRKYLLIMSIKAIWTGVVPTVSLLLLQQILNFIQSGRKSLVECFEIVGVYIFVIWFNGFFVQSITLYENTFQKKFCKYTDKLFMCKAMELDLKSFENKEIYNKINQAQIQNGTGILNYFRIFYQCAASFIALISSIVVMGRLSYWIAFGIMILPSIECVISILFRKKQYALVVKRTERERTCWYMNFLAIQGTAFKEIRLNNLKDFILNKYETLKNLSIVGMR